MASTGPSPLLRGTIDRSVSDRVIAAEQEIKDLITAAFTVIERTHTLDPPVRDILAEASRSTPAFYRHFRSKDELMLLVHDRGVRILADYLERRMSAETEGTFARIATWIDGVMRQTDPRAMARSRPFALASPQLLAAFPGERQAQEAILVVPLQREIEAGVATGELHSADPGADAWVIHDFAFAALRRHLADETTPTPTQTQRLVDFARRALAAR